MDAIKKQLCFKWSPPRIGIVKL